MSAEKKHSGIRKEQTRERFFEGLDETKVLLGFKGFCLLSCCWFSRSDKHEEEHTGFCFCSVWSGLVWSGSDLWSLIRFLVVLGDVQWLFATSFKCCVDWCRPPRRVWLVYLEVLSLQLSPLGILSLASSLLFFTDKNHN